MAKLGLVIGGVVVAGLAYLPIYEKNMINEEVQKVVTNLQNNGFSVEMTPCEGYLSSKRTFTIVVVDGAKAVNFVLDEAKSNLPKQNKLLLEKLQESLQNPAGQRDANKSFKDVTFTGNLHHSNIGTPSVDMEINLVDAPFMKTEKAKFAQLFKDKKVGVKVHYENEQNFKVALKDFKFGDNTGKMNIQGLTFFGKKSGNTFADLDNFTFDYKTPYKSSKIEIIGLHTNGNYVNKFNNKVKVKIKTIAIEESTKYSAGTKMVLNGFEMSSYVKELSTISVGLKTNVANILVSNKSRNEQLLNVQNFHFNIDIKHLAKKPFKELVKLQEDMMQHPNATKPNELQILIMKVINNGLTMNAQSSLDSINVQRQFNLSHPLKIDANFNINKNDATRVDFIKKYIDANLKITLDAKNTNSPSPMISQRMFDTYLKKGKKVGSNLIYDIKVEKGKAPTLNGKKI